MALTYSNFLKFDEVEAWYNNIKPLVSKLHIREDDIRPIGDRNRKWERIVKISRNCYALSDGYHEGDDKFTPYGIHEYDYKTKTTTTHWDRLGKMEYYAPIVWRKHKDGTETVQIRNCIGSNSSYSTGRYAFLHRHMPRGMTFVVGGNALQYVSLRGLTTVNAHYLAKCKTVPRGYYKQFKDKNYFKDWMQTKDDNSALVFTRDGGNWIHNSTTGKSLPQKPKVNKDLKKEYKDDINKFFEWGMAMSPLLPLSNEYNTDKSRELRSYYGSKDGYSHHDFTPTHAREIIRDEKHPMRLNYWVSFTTQIADYDYAPSGWEYKYPVKHVETKEDLQKMRSKFNSFINRNAGFMTKPKG